MIEGEDPIERFDNPRTGPEAQRTWTLSSTYQSSKWTTDCLSNFE